MFYCTMHRLLTELDATGAGEVAIGLMPLANSSAAEGKYAGLCIPNKSNRDPSSDDTCSNARSNICSQLCPVLALTSKNSLPYKLANSLPASASTRLDEAARSTLLPTTIRNPFLGKCSKYMTISFSN